MPSRRLHPQPRGGCRRGRDRPASHAEAGLSRVEIRHRATTLDEYRKYIEKDGALERRFQPVIVKAPTVPEAIEIIRGLRHKYEAHHRVKITDIAITAAVNLADRYITDRQLPDKAIDVIDEAASRTRLMALTPPPRSRDRKELERVIRGRTCSSGQEFEKAAPCARRRRSPRARGRAERDWDTNKGKGTQQVAKRTSSSSCPLDGIPLAKLEEKES